jgi:phage gp36-like protein
VAFLKDVAAGRAELGIDAAGAAPLEDGPAVLAGAGAARRLDEDALHDFLTGRR